MSLLDQLGGVLSNAMGGNLSEQEAGQHYDQIASTVPQSQLGAAIGPALASLGAGELQQRVTDSAAQMNPQQRGNLIQQLLGGLGGSAGGLGGLLSQLGIDPSVQNNPQNASPDDVGKLAAHAQANNPDVFHRAMAFYSEHPTLVKALGAVAIAGIARHLANPDRPSNVGIHKDPSRGAIRPAGVFLLAVWNGACLEEQSRAPRGIAVSFTLGNGAASPLQPELRERHAG